MADGPPPPAAVGDATISNGNSNGNSGGNSGGGGGGLPVDPAALADHLCVIVPLLLGGTADELRAALGCTAAAHSLKTYVCTAVRSGPALQLALSPLPVAFVAAGGWYAVSAPRGR